MNLQLDWSVDSQVMKCFNLGDITILRQYYYYYGDTSGKRQYVIDNNKQIMVQGDIW